MNIVRAALRLSLIKKLIIIAVIIGIGWFSVARLLGNQNQEPQFQTAQAVKGTLISSVSASGTVSSGSSTDISSSATGIVQEVYVQNSDSVSEGDSIALIKSDVNAQQQQTQAYASYLSAKNNVDSANANLYSLRSAKDTAWKDFYDISTSSEFENDDGTPREDMRNSSAEFQSAQGDWLAAEAKYKNQQAVITQTKVALDAAWLSYSQLSSTIIAPMSGIVSNLSITPGLVISESSSTTNSSQSIGTITLEGGRPQVSVNLTEIDVGKVKPGQKVTLTLDALPDKTFTGKVSAINTNGSVSSGVTTYPTTISFDTTVDTIYPNMAVNATIITDIKNSVILVPSGAVQTLDGASTVRVMRNGQVTSVPVEIGGTNDTQTEIVSGINEGDTVITGQTNTASVSTGAATSPFGNTRGGLGGAGGGGGQMFIQRR